MEVDKHLLLDLLNAALSADYTGVRRAGNHLAKRFLDTGDPEAAKSIQSLLRKRGVPLQASGYAEPLPRDAGSRLPLLEEGSWPTIPLFFDTRVAQALDEFLEDAQHIELLAERGVSSRLGMILHGPPGTGKSLLAGHVAARLARPFYVARLDSLISSRLGETSKNIREMFEFIPTREAVLFLDEMDAIAKLRDDRHELGELKRVVNTVLQGLDSLADKVIVIGATNHPHLLDPAIWRRFPYKIELGSPPCDVRAEMWKHFLFEDNKSHEQDAQILGALSEGLTGSDIQTLALATRRRAILNGGLPSLRHLILAMVDSGGKAGRLPDARELTPDERRRVAVAVNQFAEASQSDISRILGVSRQMVHRYLKES